MEHSIKIALPSVDKVGKSNNEVVELSQASLVGVSVTAGSSVQSVSSGNSCLTFLLIKRFNHSNLSSCTL